MEEAQNHFKEQSALQCSICLDDMGCTDNIKVLPCLHEFHNKCIQDVIKNNPKSYRCPLCRKDCNIDSERPINLESTVIFSHQGKRKIWYFPSFLST